MDDGDSNGMDSGGTDICDITLKMFAIGIRPFFNGLAL